MFVGLITQPYHIEPEIESKDLESMEEYERHELTLFLDGFAYAGLVNLQDIQQKWPATSG